MICEATNIWNTVGRECTPLMKCRHKPHVFDVHLLSRICMSHTRKAIWHWGACMCEPHRHVSGNLRHMWAACANNSTRSCANTCMMCVAWDVVCTLNRLGTHSEPRHILDRANRHTQRLARHPWQMLGMFQPPGTKTTHMGLPVVLGKC